MKLSGMGSAVLREWRLEHGIVGEY